MTQKHYSQDEKHRYVWYCVQGIVDLENRSRQLAFLTDKHRLSSDQIADLNERLVNLDASRQERERQQQERASMSPVQYAIAHPTRNNLIRLRSGRDRLSNIGLLKLRNMAGEQSEIEKTELTDADKAAAYRWVLRGLPAGLAMSKIIYGSELDERRERRNYVYDLHEEDAQAREWLDESKERQSDEWRERKDRERDNRRHRTDFERDDEIVTYLAGGKYYDTTGAVEGPVDLEWEPTNPHDPNAIKIKQGGIHLGYVPKGIAPTIRLGSTARLATAGYPWTVIIQQRKPFSFILPKLLVGIERQDRPA